MIKITIIIIIGFLLTNISKASCNSEFKYNINLDIQKTKYIYDKNSIDIPYIQIDSESKHLLGTYNSYVSFEAEWSKEFDHIDKCGKIKTMNINLILNSNIYVAHEILPYECTFNRTIAHELQHHQNKENALNYGVNYLKNNLEKVFSLKYYSNNPEEFKQYIQNQLEILQKQTFKEINENTYIYDKVIDTEENYRKESLVCSQSEREIVDQSFN